MGSIIKESYIYLFIISHLATTELRSQFKQTIASFITNYISKLFNQTIAVH